MKMINVFTSKELAMVTAFYEIYSAIILKEKGVEKGDIEYNTILKQSADEVVKVMYNFKLVHYPNEEMNIEDLTDFETEFLISKFGMDKVADIVEEVL